MRIPVKSISNYTILCTFSKNIVWTNSTLILYSRNIHIMSNCSQAIFRDDILVQENTVFINRIGIIGHLVIDLFTVFCFTVGQGNWIVIH